MRFPTFYSTLSVKVLLLLISLCVSFSACGNIEIIDDEDKDKTEKTDQSGGSASSAENDEDHPASVQDIIQGSYDEDFVWVEGYIVGYASGTVLSASTAVFGLPENAVNTNLLLADSPDECDFHNIIPVQLPTKDGIRDALNLYDNPELLNAKVRILGLSTTYFRVKGLKEVEAYYICEEGEVSEPVRQGETFLLNHQATVLEGR